LKYLFDAFSNRCFHAATTREKATKLLEHTAEGTYLIRSSNTETGNYSVSIREASDVKHFRIDFDGERYGFGQALFWSPFQIWGHLQERPVLECEEGMPLVFTIIAII
jgi:dual adaptor for phosphotyrosine/3-phosphotyrosine/3-phosphoinositide